MAIWILLLWPALAQDSVNSRDANLEAARAYIAQGNLAKAAESLDLVLAANPDGGSEPYLTLVDCRLKLDQKEKALAASRQLPSPKHAAALEFAMLLTRQSRQGEAQKLLDEILKFAPGFGPAHLERAKYLSAQGDLESALAEAKIALDRAGSDPKS